MRVYISYFIRKEGARMSHKRFTFDDSQEIKADKKSKEKTKKNKKNKKDKKKRVFRIWHIFALLFVLIVGGAVAYVFVSTNNNGPVYGDRCKGILAVNKEAFSETESEIGAKPEISSIAITKSCRSMDIVITYKDNINSQQATAIATETLQTLDRKLGIPKTNPEDAYSEAFGFSEGRGQYNVNFRLRSEGQDQDFPIFGTKQPKVNDISFTKRSVADPETTDKVNKQKSEADQS